MNWISASDKLPEMKSAGPELNISSPILCRDNKEIFFAKYGEFTYGNKTKKCFFIPYKKQLSDITHWMELLE